MENLKPKRISLGNDCSCADCKGMRYTQGKAVALFLLYWFCGVVVLFVVGLYFVAVRSK